MLHIDHDVHYYETDKMGVVHHSNYIRWFEDARIAWLEQAGTPFVDVEAEGVISPVVGLTADYKHPSVFGDRIRVYVTCTKFNGIRLEYAYRAVRDDGQLVMTGTSKHCFQQADSPRPVNMAKLWPDMYEKILAAFKADQAEA